MKNFGKIIGINLIILLVYSVLAYFINGTSGGSSGYDALGYGFILMVFLVPHVLVNLIIAIVKFVRKEKELGSSYLLSMFIVAIVGFSSCAGGMELFY